MKSEIVRDHWRAMMAAAVADPDQAPDRVRDRVERYWPGLTSEPGGVDYLAVDVHGLPALWAIPKGSSEEHVILGVHGGGGVSGSIYTHRKLFAHMAEATGVRALIVEYSRRGYPAPLDDALTAYRWLLGREIDPGRIAIAGDSLGGNLSISAILRAREAGLPTPAALFLMSPWVDMTVGDKTFETNRETEEFFYRDVVLALASTYLSGADPTDPFASPLHAELNALPPTYIQVGGDETLLGESARFAEKARAAGVDVRLDIFPGQLHTFQMAAGNSAESTDAIERFATWARPKLGLAHGE
ncbi:alpha/beta hydrolase [Nocardia aurantia]|uniref:Monoterpene epsilon-lactone hydrolase n=1 Tax=Nocardia aurantia TaxID=2585199 RepID=A0A7K0DTL7_9NOCA|nr:alpha/beta hydrolase [Nocardia aurantia]MQY28877.1 Monoterpene epsilon-lactone hydrolase [Nocardia aurantia]